MSREARRGGIALASVATLATLALAVLAARALSFYSSIAQRSPAANGALLVAGLEGPVHISRDRFGIPHVRATTADDAFTGLGFAHAQDRLWQLEFLRRSARGTLSELFGSAALPTDRLARTLGLYREAREEARSLRPSTRALLEAYRRGVNRWIEQVRERSVPVPFEFEWLDLEPEPWELEDTLLLVRLRSWSYGRSLDLTLLLDKLVRELGGVASQDFFPPLADPEDERVGGLLRIGRTARAFASLVGMRGPVGSGGFAVGGARTKTGLPILANDPHLQLRLPTPYYLAHLSTPDWQVAGGTWPGVPVFWVGTNRTIAWGQVALHASVSDLYDESLHPDKPSRYDWGGHWRDGERRSETIRVRGGSDQVIEIVSTRHGPLLGSIDPETRTASSYALRWTGQGPDSGIDALLAVPRAGDWLSFRAALEGVPAPAATFLYGDREGNIGSQVAGRLPIRSIDTGLLPVPGRTSFYDWRGFIPFDELPSRYGKELPFLIASTHPTANGFAQRVAYLSGSGGAEDRLRRVLSKARAFTLDDVTRIQSERVSSHGPELVASLIEGIEPDDENAARLRDQLRDWDGDTGESSLAAAVFHLFRRRLTERLLAGRLAEPYVQDVLAMAEPVPGALLGRFLERVGPEEARALAEQSLEETWSWLGVHVSSNPAKWTWGRVHQLHLRHPFEELGGVLLRQLGSRLGRGPFAAPGSPDSIWTMYSAPEPPFEVTVGPALRLAIDLEDPDHIAFGLAGGQSGHPGDPLYDDALADWLAARSRPLWLHPTDVAYHERGVWELLPPD